MHSIKSQIWWQIFPGKKISINSAKFAEGTMRFLFFSLAAILLILSVSACASRNAIPPAQPGYVDAVELKLKCRELADQMLATVPNDAIKGFVAMPTSFVNENNTSESSPLGRLMAEAMFYEFNQRGFPTREYRLTGNINVVGGKNDLALAANQIVPTKGQNWAALIVGTYYVDRDATFVNVRLVRASDGLVLRSGQLVLANSPIVERMSSTAASDNSFGLFPLSSALYPASEPYSANGPGYSIRIIQGK